MIARGPADVDPLDRAREALRETFGFDTFRAGQQEVVEAVLAGRDVLCVMPTGAGKSLCYQLPALVREGLTLVVSPLIALMEDQVSTLRARGVAVAAIHSGVSPEERSEAMEAALRGDLRLLYVAPERFRSQRFRDRMRDLPLDLVAVDEAHCISQWGHDFRPDYRRMGEAMEALGRPQILALTATATPDVQNDVVAQLALREPARFVRGIVRENLIYEVHHTRGREAKDQVLLGLASEPGCTLIYAATRKNVERIYERLRLEGHDVRRYHAGLSDASRAESQRAFLEEGAPLLVATNAFGMGIDRSDIRRVVHYDIPRSVEAYVQESGRAGRDGDPARCLLLFNPGDLHVQRFFIDASHPPREVVRDVFRVLHEMGEARIELTSEAIADRLHVKASPPAVSAALSILDRAALVRRRRRGEGDAKLTVLPSAGDLFQVQPLLPGLSRLLAALVERYGVDREVKMDLSAFAGERGVTEETVRRGLGKLNHLGRIIYVPPFRGRATELTADEDGLDDVDFEGLQERRRHEERKLEEMIGFAHAPGCRVLHLLRCFGAAEGEGPCGRCDRCTGNKVGAGQGIPTSAHGQAAIRKALEGVQSFDGRYGFRKLAGHLAGSDAAGVGTGPLAHGPTRGALRSLGVKGAERYLRICLDAGLLRLVPRKLGNSGRTVHLIALAPLGLRVFKGGPLPTVGE